MTTAAHPLAPDPVALCVAAMAAQEAGRIDEAVAGFAAALDCAPAMLDLRVLLAYALAAAGDRDGARASLDGAPDVSAMSRPDARRLADAACELRADRVALRAIDRALHFGADDADLHANRGAVLQRLGDADGAQVVLDAAAARWPAHVPVLMNRANLDAERGASHRALAAYDDVLRLQPAHARARSNRGLVRLSRGDLGGWQDYEARRSLPFHTVLMPAGIPAWLGQDPANLTLLLWGEQGLGDQIMGARFASMLAARGARVVVRCHPSLVSIVRTAAGVSHVVADGDALPRCDAHVPMFSVPALLGMNSETQYGNAPYLPVDAATHRTRRVGIVWAGSSSHGNDHNRSLPAAMLSSLLDVAGVEWTSLQLGPRSSDLETLPPRVRERVLDSSGVLRDFSDTARAIAACDALVTVDTSVAHVAGAIGARTLMLLPHVADWRWGSDREDSMWYGSMQLIRQPDPDDWKHVILRVHKLLETA